MTVPKGIEAGATANVGLEGGLEKGGPQQSGHANRLSSGSATMSMDLSVSMDVFRTHEESMDITGEPSGIAQPQNENPVVEGVAQDTSRRQQPDQSGYASNKRRKIVNSKLNLRGSVGLSV